MSFHLVPDLARLITVVVKSLMCERKVRNLIYYFLGPLQPEAVVCALLSIRAGVLKIASFHKEALPIKNLMPFNANLFISYVTFRLSR